MASAGASASTVLPARMAAARPNTTKSIKEFEPNLFAPCTEAHPASPTAIRPGTIEFGSATLGLRTSPQKLVGMPPML